MFRFLFILVTVSGLCNKGQYNERLDAGTNLECRYCPKGYYNGRLLHTLTECFRCNTGTFQDQPGSALCKNCPGGFSQNSPAGVNCTECDHYITQSSECVEICPVHSWKNDTTKKCDFCNPGQYSVGDSQTCQQCQLGYYKEQAGPSGCKQCPSGYISNVTTCHECAAGQGVSDGVCNDCIAGKYAYSGVCYECGSGKYTSDPKQTECISCSIGKFQDSNQATTCTDCASGQYVNNTGAVLCIDCPAGYGTNVEGRTTCEQCFGAQTVNGVCVDCEQGFFLNDQQCITCPKGWISAKIGCSKCSGVQYTDDKIECKDCAANSTGNIRDGGSWKCCEEGDGECEDCPAGEYRLINDCVNCPIGWVSKTAGLCEQCDYTEGEYSSQEGQSICEKCKEGQSTDGQICTNCGPGQYELKFQCTNCPRGWYSDNSQNPVCTQCGVRKTTAVAGSTKKNECSVECTEATFVDQYGDCQECDLGRYVVDRECQDCPFGTHKDIRGDTQCRDCPAGFTTEETGNIDCFICPVGETCGCGWGEFGIKGNCQNCPVGYFSTGNKECTACPVTTYQDQEGQGTCRDCPTGLYGDQLSLDTCKDCVAGQFQMTTGNTACDDCPKGRWSTLAVDECTNCTAGKTTADTSSVEVNDCEDCTIGKMEKDHLCINCFEGTYQNKKGATVCDTCPGTTWSSPGARESSECFGTKGLRTYTFGNIQDSKQTTPYKTLCELRPNFVMVCPTCTCDADARNGFWAGPLCNECRRGFATRFCTSICPGYDGRHDSTICNGNGRCWFGRQGNGLCYCGGKHILDESSENVFVDVQYCPAGKICPGYGGQKVSQTTYIPLYYLINYRQYSTFVLQMSKYTPQRGHMWFKRFSPTKAFENTCTVCNTKYLDSALTEIGYWDHENSYNQFPLSAQTQNGFHGENCQYECAVCLNGGECVHSPHPYRYIYTILNTFKEQRSAIYPTTTCLCSANVFDTSHMCCPNGFQPYVYYGKRGTTPYSQYSTIPYITSVDNNIDLGYYRDLDLSLEIDQQTVYIEPEDRQITVPQGTRVVDRDFSTVGPYNNHVYHGTTKEICRACPGLFGKGIRVVDSLLQREQDAENYWWNFPASAGSKKCRGQGVCDFYEKPREMDVDFMGHITNYAMLHRGRMCKSRSIGGFVNMNGQKEITSLEDCVEYAQSNSANFVGWAPEFYMGGESDDINQKDFETEINAKSSAAANAAEAWVKNTLTLEYSIVQGDLPAPNSDSLYEIHPRIVKRCIVFTNCFELRPIESTAYRAFNIYTVEKGRSDERLKEATFDRFDTCFTYTKNYDHDPEKVGKRQTFGLYLTQNYKQGKDPFLGGLCPKGYFCTQNSDGTGFKEACPIGYHQPLEGQTRTVSDIHCSRQSTFSNKGVIYSPPSPVANAYTITNPEKCTEILLNLGYVLNHIQTSEHAPYGCYLESTLQGYEGRFNNNKESRTHSNGQKITTECFSTNNMTNNDGGQTQYWYKCVLDNTPCQSNLATKSSIDFVDNICQRCPRDSFSPEGSYKCTTCPSGRVKKISGEFDPRSIEIYNTPDIPKPFWYYIANEGGTESDDCAVVPSAVIHVPTANGKMFESPDNEQFLPVISCPFGYSSQPGTYIIDDIWNMQNIIVEDEDIMIEPYINIEGDKQLYESNVQCCLIKATLESEYVTPESEEVCRELTSKSNSDSTNSDSTNIVPGLWHGCLRFDQSNDVEYLNDNTQINHYPTKGVTYICQKVIRDKSLMEALVSSYCYPCPGDSMTGPASSMCSTCTANLIKKNMKISLQKLVMNAETRMYHCGEIKPILQTNENQQTHETAAVNTLPKCTGVEREHNDVSIDIKYKKDIPAWYFLQMLDRTWDAEHVFSFINVKDPSLSQNSIELTITDCILACSTVFNKDYNISSGVIPVRVGYARDTKLRKWCVCNEGNRNNLRDATGIAVNKEANSGTCKDLIGENTQTIKPEDCVKESEVKVIWYESVIVDNWATTDFPLCGLCKPGTRYTSSVCEDCERGKFTADMKQSMTDSCKLCPAGFFQDTTGKTGCNECRPGFFQENGAGHNCKSCPKGFHQNDFQGKSCKHCTQGRIQRIAAQSKCIACEPGYFESSDDTDTTINKQACTVCPKGKATDQPGQGQCANCNPGQYQDTTAQLTCKKCDKGRYEKEPASPSNCKACPKGYVQPLDGFRVCDPCFGDTVATIPPKCETSDDCLWSTATKDQRSGEDGAEYQANSGELTCNPCPHSHICTYDALPEKCGPGHVMPAGVYTKACYKCDGQFWADPDNQGKCTLCGEVGAPGVVNAAATACTKCEESEGNVVRPLNCGEDVKCTSCKQCEETQWAKDNVCRDCPIKVPIRLTGNKCVVCPKNNEKTSYMSSNGQCIDCPARGWKIIKKSGLSAAQTGCESCAGFRLHWYKEKGTNYQQGEMLESTSEDTNAHIHYKGPWQSCCWDTNDYVKISTWIVTSPNIKGYLFIGNGVFNAIDNYYEDWIEYKLRDVAAGTVRQKKIKETLGSKEEICLEAGKIFYLEFEYQNADGNGNFNVYTHNANTFKEKPDGIGVSICDDNNPQNSNALRYTVPCVV